jgi:hypothetical protein
MTETVPELTGYQATAAELRRIADAIEHLELNREVPWVTLSFLPSAAEAPPEQKIADVDTVASAVLGCTGQREVHNGGVWHGVRATPNGVYININERLGDASEDER